MTANRRILATATLICLLVVSAAAASHRKRPRDQNSTSGFDYYLLALSYAPDFCDQPAGHKDPRECGPGRRLGFVVHGMWPQSQGGRGPANCTPASPVSQEILRTTLNYIPTESLIQHEWSTHGTCSGLSAADYFAALRKARDSVIIPADLKQPSGRVEQIPADVEAKFAAANPSFPKDAVRVTCYADGELQEIRICFNKDLSPRACDAGSGRCRSPHVVLNPVR